MTSLRSWGSLALACTVTACAGTDAPTGPTGPGFAITVAPLELEGVVNACYSIDVYNVPKTSVAPSARVWSKTAICSTQYGDGAGDITYIGTCDASPDGRVNTTALVLEGLCRQVGCEVGNDEDPKTLPSTAWNNPCPSTAPCMVERPCRENADVLVEFNLTVMRQANQGFFDVAVNFEDVFCSAKLDCVPELLHNPDAVGAGRDLTAVLGFACTSGASNTCLYATQLTLTCGAQSWTLDPSAGPGLIPESSPLLFAAATYRGDEAFTAFDKTYWNVALGLDKTQFETYPNCTLTWTTTASEAPLTNNTTPARTTYPVIRWERDIVVGGTLACGAHALNEVLENEDAAAVATDYTEADTPVSFLYTTCPSTSPDTCECPANYTVATGGESCEQNQTATPTANGTVYSVCNGSNDATYAMRGARFTASWDPATFEYDDNSLVYTGGPCTSPTNDATCLEVGGNWVGRLAQVGVWTCEVDPNFPFSVSRPPSFEWIGFSRCIQVETAGEYLIGVGADNRVRLRVDGQDVYVSQAEKNFRAWNIGRISLSAGPHVIELYGLNMLGPAAFGAEIYGPFTAAQVATPTAMSQALNPNLPLPIIFSTASLRDSTTAVFDTSLPDPETMLNPTGFTCPAGFALNLCGAERTCTRQLVEQCLE